MVLKLFTQPSCPKCPDAKELCANLKLQASSIKQEYFDVTTVEGLAEASFYTVMATPSILIIDDKGEKIGDWRGETPSIAEVINIVNH